MARQGRKQERNLLARTQAWDKMPKVGDKDAKGPNAKGTYFRKPGSNKK